MLLHNIPKAGLRCTRQLPVDKILLFSYSFTTVLRLIRVIPWDGCHSALLQKTDMLVL